MLLDPVSWTLAQTSDSLLPELSPRLAGNVSAETHACTLELATGVHSTVRSAAAELYSLRATLAAELHERGLRAAVAGTHPLAHGHEIEVSGGARYQLLHEGLRVLARREPTFALHVHVGVPDPEARGARRRPAARPPSADPRPVRQLAFLARSRQRAGIGPHAAVPGLSARRRAARRGHLRDYVERLDRCCGPRRSRSRPSSGGTCACSPASALSRCASSTPRRASPRSRRWPPHPGARAPRGDEGYADEALVEAATR